MYNVPVFTLPVLSVSGFTVPGFTMPMLTVEIVPVFTGGSTGYTCFPPFCLAMPDG